MILYPEFRRMADSLHGLGVTGLDVVWLCMEIWLVWTFCIGTARHILDRLSSFIWNYKGLSLGILHKASMSNKDLI